MERIMEMMGKMAEVEQKMIRMYVAAAYNAEYAEITGAEDAAVKIAYRNGMKKAVEMVLTYDDIRGIDERAFETARYTKEHSAQM